MLALVAAVVVVRALSSGHAGGSTTAAATGLPTSCVSPAFRVDGTRFAAGGPIIVDTTGPANVAYVVAVDDGGRSHELFVADGLPHCRDERQVSLPKDLASGRHTLTLSRRVATGPPPTLQTIAITIT